MNLEFLKDSAKNAKTVLEELDLEKIHEISEFINNRVLRNKILICGNGGSAAQAAHFEGELIGRYNKERKPVPGICLSLSGANMTCIANDYGEKKIFSRGVEALGNSGDVLFCLSTSGNSENLIEAIKSAKEKDMLIISLLGRDGGKVHEMSDYSYIVNSESTARIQEAHIFIIHSICEYLEE